MVILTREKARCHLLTASLVSRGKPLCTFVDEIIGLPLVMGLFPQVLAFEGDAVLELVERGVYRKGFRVRQSPEGPDEQR